ncbi:VMO1 protein, partial [Picathartes gymnocephalus]|nr:VMO1 protein [Picathartes gymnocephalus]
RLEITNASTGTWGDWSPRCPRSWGVCGIQSRLQPPQDGGDETALNDLKLYCCP